MCPLYSNNTYKNHLLFGWYIRKFIVGHNNRFSTVPRYSITSHSYPPGFYIVICCYKHHFTENSENYARYFTSCEIWLKTKILDGYIKVFREVIKLDSALFLISLELGLSYIFVNMCFLLWKIDYWKENCFGTSAIWCRPNSYIFW